MPHRIKDQYGRPLSFFDEWNNVWSAPFVTGAVCGAVCMAILFYFKFKKDNKEDFKIADFYRGMYIFEAKNGYHNLRKYLNHFRNLVIEEQKSKSMDFTKSTDFAKDATRYLTSALNMADWEYGKWTFQNELDYFFTYLDLYNSSSDKNIQFIPQYDGIDTSVTRMVPDIFITLLQNSIEHGYEKEQLDWYFIISAKKIKNYLQIEVKDNGIPKDIEAFTKKTERLSGLEVLKNKIRQNWIISGKDLNRKLKSVEFEATKEHGTNVRIRIPYETISARTYS